MRNKKAGYGVGNIYIQPSFTGFCTRVEEAKVWFIALITFKLAL